MILNLKKIEDYILNYKNDDLFIFYLKLIFKNLLYLKEVKVKDFFLEKKFSIEFELEREFFKLELDANFFSMQVNSIEQYYVLENDAQIEELINDLFKGNYIKKYFVNKNGKVRFLKLIWNNRSLKKYNVKYKIGWLSCKNKIRNIHIEKGIVLKKV